MPSYKCIIIDDSSMHRLSISFLIKNHPELQFVGAFADPTEGIKVAQEEKVDFIFLDVLLEHVNAFELLEHYSLPGTIILNSSWKKFGTRAKQYGIRHFLVKPMQKEAFYNIMAQALMDKKKEKAGQLNHKRPYLNTTSNSYSLP